MEPVNKPSAISAVVPLPGSLRLFYLLPDGQIGQSAYMDRGWIHYQPAFAGDSFSPLASVAWGDGKEVSMPPCFRRVT